MSFAYKWFFENQIDGIQNFQVFVKPESIAFHFRRWSTRDQYTPCGIGYVKNGSSTSVSTFSDYKKIEMEESMIEVFCEDFKEFLINQNTILDELLIWANLLETDANNRIFECIKSALESRKEKFKVRYIASDMFNSKQVIELLQFMNPVVLTRVDFFLSNFDDVIDYLVKWNQGCRLKVIFKYMAFSTEKVTSFKKMFNYPSVFSHIQFRYVKSNDFKKQQLIEFFEPFKPSKYESYYIEFELEDPSVVNLSEQAARFSLRDICSLEVFANPLLMEIIVEQIDYFDILSLRKVSRDIRSCIDTLKPDPRIASYQIYILNFARISNNTPPVYYSSNDIRLKNGNKKCLISPYGTYECNIDIRVVCVEAINLFKRNILHQKSKIYDFFLEPAGNLIELIGDVLKSRNTRLSVKRLQMTRSNENDIMNILPYLDSVESILNFFAVEQEPMILNLAEVSKLVQWKNALELEMKNYIIENSIEELNLINFQKIDIKIAILSTNDVIYLKENILKSVKFNKFEIKFEDSLIDDRLYTSMPPYHRVPNNRSVWFFPMPISNNFLHILLYEQKKLIVFKLVDKDDVPEDVSNQLV